MKKRSGFKVMQKLIGLIKPLTGFMLLAIFMGLIGNLCASFITIFGGYALLGVLNDSIKYPVSYIFISMAFFALVRGILRYAEQSCNHYIAFKLLALIRDKVFRALRKLSPAKLEGRDKGNLISIITSDIELLEVFYAHTVSPIVIAFLFTVIMCAFIAHYHIILALVALAAYLITGVLIPVLVSGASGDAGNDFREKSGELSSFVLDSLRGLSETLQYAGGEKRLREMNRKTDELSKIEKKMKKMAGINIAVTNLVILSFDFMMLFTSLWLFTKGEVSAEGVVIATLALMSSFGPAVALAGLGSTLQNTFAAGNRVLDILEETPVTEEITGEETIAFTGAGAEHVSFSYGGETILKDVSVSVSEGKIIGIAGKSGSGKSTLLKLFMRFWDSDSGRITISEKNIKNINTKNLRDMEGYMTQETHMFHDSIKNNIKIAKLDATDEEIINACKKASVHAFIRSLPMGYDTPVGELGDTISGGEKQRFGLARAFLQDAPFLLLDEPTSNLDSLNEAVILKSLKEEKGERTVLLVSHRKSGLRIADTVINLETEEKHG